MDKNASEFKGGTPLEECEDIDFLRQAVANLWAVIDDIDTYSDMAKGNDRLYRNLVEKRQRRRWNLGISCDGYDLFLVNKNEM